MRFSLRSAFFIRMVLASTWLVGCASASRGDSEEDLDPGDPCSEYGACNPSNTATDTSDTGTDSQYTTTSDTSNAATDTGDTDSISDTGTDTSPSGSDDTDEPEDTGAPAEPPVLGAYHPGWKDPGCWSASCHQKKQTHNPQMKPHDCAKCHGKNGATKRTPHFPCVGCHSPIKDHDPVADFSNTGTCLNCHN